MEHIRNFCIIAHIDHGKSTLADRFLELTGTIEKRKMTDQAMDRMELEKERGITIKMKPVRMIYKINHSKILNSKSENLIKLKLQSDKNQSNLEFRDLSLEFANSEFILNLIDTPGHVDFSYEVSRALKAVEGAIVLVDATQGVQAQTLSVLSAAKEAGLTLIPVVSKIDSPLARTLEVKKETAELLGCSVSDVMEVSGKTGEGVERLLQEIINKIPPPNEDLANTDKLQALVFDSEYSNHAGLILFIRVFNGQVKSPDSLRLSFSQKDFRVNEVGTFNPHMKKTGAILKGEIGYIVTGVKEAGLAVVGDTVISPKDVMKPLQGYDIPKPVVWASLYPSEQDDFLFLKQAINKLRLSDSSISAEEESSGILGKGFRCGFLGMLHLEIAGERLKREFGAELIITSPTVTYEVESKGKKSFVSNPAEFPENPEFIFEPWAELKIFTPPERMGEIIKILYDFEASLMHSENFGDKRVSMTIEMPLRELMRNFFDAIKSASSGYASLSYTLLPNRIAKVVRLEVLLAEEVVPAFSKIVGERRMETEAESMAEKLHKLIPRQLFNVKVQVRANGRIIASRTISAMRKNVTGHLYGGDVTRKRKLLEEQKRGKERLKERGIGKVAIPPDVFLKMVSN